MFLVFEDSDADVVLLKLSLDTHFGGYEFKLVGDGEQALETILDCVAKPEARPDLFVIDLGLPKASGLEILGRIKSAPELRSIAAVVMTSSDSPADQAAAEKLNVAAYIRKPADLKEFLAIGETFKDLLADRA